MTDFHTLIQALASNNVDFIIVGGVAATIHGSARLTEDLDIVYRRSDENYERLVAALRSKSPYLRGAPPGLPFRWDKDTLRLGLNFTLTTEGGPIDLLGEITGGGGYDQLLPESVKLMVLGVECYCLSLDQLIRVKRAAGRPKDFEALAELEAIAEERRDLS